MVTNHAKGSKWDADREGPFKVLRQNQSGAYVLMDPMGDEMGKHYTSEMIFPINKVPNEPSKIATEPIKPQEETFEVKKIIDHNQTANGYEYLVQWKGYDSDEDSWVKGSDFDTLKPINLYWRKMKKVKQRGTTSVNNKPNVSTSGLGGSHVRSRPIKTPVRFRTDT